MSSDSAAFAGSVPQHYDTYLGPVMFVDYAADVARNVALLQPARVLETAAGTGIVTRALRDTLPPTSHLTSTELQNAMLDIARAKFREGERVTFSPADAMALPFADATFDAVVCAFGVMFFPDKGQGYREVYRILAKGGTYFLSVWDSHDHNAFARITNDLVVHHFPNDPPPFMTIPFSYPLAAIQDSLVTAGFTNVAASVVTHEKVLLDVSGFARGLIFGSPIADQIRSRSDVDPERFVADLATRLEREFGPSGRMTLQAILVTAEKP